MYNEVKTFAAPAILFLHVFPFGVKQILLHVSRVFAEKSGKICVYLVSVFKRAAKVLAVKLFYPRVHGEAFAPAEPEKTYAVGNFRTYPRVTCKFFFKLRRGQVVKFFYSFFGNFFEVATRYASR